MKRVIVSAISVFICFLLQSSVFELIKLAGIVPNILIILTASVAIMRGQKEGMMVGFFAGLLLDIFYGSTIGGFAFLYMLIGFVDGFYHRIYYSNDNLFPLLIIGGSDLAYGFIMYVVCGLLHNHLHFFYYMKSIILPEVVYTVAVALVLYQILLRINDWLEKEEKRGADFV
ncbi:MAG: rod shape-determining protein MreD [Eubacterium sp.]|nr:rod shape-determining protein MreD [Eubacterium sp.]MDD7209285.1 rod shape-determining protein MreD [Lachnospiraceae bacterium]MDY5497347.1 rod shape-determining protein MreD [Anaerobutyricum sp.]